MRWQLCVATLLLKPLLHRGCDFCASLLRPQIWPSRRWRQKVGREVALVVQGWCTGRSGIAMDTWSPRSFEHIQNSRQRSPRRSVAQRKQEEGTRIAVVDHWSVKMCVRLRTMCINLGDASAFLEPPLCPLWPTNGVRWTIAVATTLPPFGDYGNPWATLTMVLPALCLLRATCCATKQLWSFEEGTRVGLQQLHRNRTF